MEARKRTGLRAELTAFLHDFVGTLGNSRQRRWCDAYLRGVLLDGRRKSVEPVAARLKALEEPTGSRVDAGALFAPAAEAGCFAQAPHGPRQQPPQVGPTHPG